MPKPNLRTRIQHQNTLTVFPFAAILQGFKSPPPPQPTSTPLTTLSNASTTTMNHASTTILTDSLPPYSAQRAKNEFSPTFLSPIEEEPTPEEGPCRLPRQHIVRRSYCNANIPMKSFPSTSLKTVERIAKQENAAEKAARAHGRTTQGVGGQADEDRVKELQRLGDIWTGLDAGESESGRGIDRY